MKICIFGDSIGKGVVLPESGHYKILRFDFSRLFGSKPVEIKNYSLFGCTITRALPVIEQHAPELTGDETVFLEVGGNDCDFDWQAVSDSPDDKHECKTPFGVFEDSYRNAVDILRNRGAKPVMLTMPPMIPQRYFDWVSAGKNAENILRWLGGTVETMYRWQEMYNLRVVMLSRTLDVKLVDIRTAFLENHFCESLISRDGIHPSEAGYELIYKTVADAMISGGQR